MLDGAAKTKAMAEEAARLRQPAIGLTDHGYLFGAFDFYMNCKNAGVKPIIGLEAYVTPGTSRFDRQKVLWGEPWQRADDVSAGGSYNHLTLVAYNTTGMHNLFRLGSYASTDGQFGKWPRADKELLSQFNEGLIVFTGCPSGAVQTRLRLGQWDEAELRPRSCATFSGRRTSTSRSWTTASTSSGAPTSRSSRLPSS